MCEQPSPGHHWLQKLVGQWTVETESRMGPDQPPTTMTGRETVRSLGGLWILGEWTDIDGDAAHTNLTTLGYDPRGQCFVGSFVTSMMSHFWPYRGTLDPAGKVLTLDSEGPNLAGDGTMAKYQDIIELVDDDHRILSSRVLQPDGTWLPFMTAHYRRVAATAPAS